MIHHRNGHTAAAASQKTAEEMLKTRLVELRRIEREAGQWIINNPLMGLSLALIAGIGLGLLLRKKS